MLSIGLAARAIPNSVLMFICITSACGLLTSGCFSLAAAGVISAGAIGSQDRTLGEIVDDSKISIAIRKEIVAKKFGKILNAVKINVDQGRVLCTGNVSSDDELRALLESVWSVRGVKEVINEVNVGAEGVKFDFAQYTKDSWITTQIKSKTIFDGNIKFVNYTVVTMNNVVYLFGVARSEDELSRIAKIAASVQGVERVVSYCSMLEVLAHRH